MATSPLGRGGCAVSIHNDTTFMDLVEELIAADGRVMPEEQAIASWFRFVGSGSYPNIPGLPQHQREPVVQLDEEGKDLLFQDLGLIAACDGDLAQEEAVWLERIGEELGLPRQNVGYLIQLAGLLAEELHEDPTRLTKAMGGIREVRKQLELIAQRTHPSGASDAPEHLNGIGASAAVGGAAGGLFATVINEIVEQAGSIAGTMARAAIKGKDALTAASEKAASPEAIDATADGDVGEAAGEIAGDAVSGTVSDIAEEVVGTSLEELPVAGGAIAIGALATSIKDGKIREAGEKVAVLAGKKGVALAAGTAAGAVATSAAYAGVGGTLLQAGVWMGLCAPPTYVVVVPLVATTLAGVGIGVLYKKVRKRRQDDA